MAETEMIVNSAGSDPNKGQEKRGSDTIYLAISAILVIFFVLIHSLCAHTSAQEVIGTAGNTLTVEGKGSGETALGYFFTDAARDAANTDAAVIPAQMLLMPLKKGDVTDEILKALTDYGEDTLVIIKINGETLKALFEQSFRLYSRENINFLHVSGLRVTFDPQKKPGERVTLIERRVPVFPLNLAAEFFFPEIEKSYVVYVKITPETSYMISTLKFFAYGPMGYFKIFSAKQIVKVLPVTLHQALVRFVHKKKRLRYETENRFIKIPPRPEEEKPASEPNP